MRTRRVALGLGVAFAALRVWAIAGVRPGRWNDTASYERVADAGWFSQARWAGERPPLLPLVLELTGGNDRATVWVQTLVSIACWLFLAWVVAHVAADECDGRRLLGGGLVLALALSPPVTQWDGAVLSESLALSTTALLVACGLRLVSEPRAGRAVAVVAAAAAWGMCRDTHLWLLGGIGIAVGVALVVLALRRREAPLFPILAVACACMVIAVLGTAASSAGDRDEFPLSNAMAVRILPYPDRIDWFADRGMPQADALRALASDPYRVQGTGVPAVFVDTGDPSWSEYETWLDESGRRAYVEWLATHPDYVVIEPFRSPERVFNNGDADWAFYRPPDYDPVPLTWLLFPPWWVTTLAGLAATVVVVRASAWRRPTKGPSGAWWVGVVVALLSIPHALLAWHGDGMEAARHALVACVQLRIGVVVMVAVAIAAWPSRQTLEPTEATGISTG